MMSVIKKLMLSITVMLTLVSCNTSKQQENYAVGIINLNPHLDPIITEFKKDMDQRGYKDGVNITYIYNGALNNRKQVEREVLNMFASDVDLLFTMTTPVAKIVKKMNQGKNLPVLFAPSFSPVASGVVGSLASPDGNITGIKIRGSTAKALDWFLKAVPSTKRIFVPFHYTDKAAIYTLEDLKEAANFFKIELVIANLSTEEDLNKVLSDIPDDIDAVWLVHSYLIISNAEKIITSATALKKPVGTSTAGQYKDGVIVSYGASLGNVGKQAGRMVDKIFKGVSPAAMPVETSDYFLGLNLKTARAIGLKIPDEVIAQADFVKR